jgi:beta-galactosidase
LQLVPDRQSLAGEGRDAEPVTVQAIDSEGRVVPTANLPVRFELEGPGAIIGLNNGDPNCHEPEKGDSHSLFNGLAQVIVQTAEKTSGKIKLRATADGLAGGETEIEVKSVPAPPEVDPVKRTIQAN